MHFLHGQKIGHENVQNNVRMICTYYMYILHLHILGLPKMYMHNVPGKMYNVLKKDVHTTCTFNMYILYVHKKCTYVMYRKMYIV